MQWDCSKVGTGKGVLELARLLPGSKAGRPGTSGARKNTRGSFYPKLPFQIADGALDRV